MMDSPLAWSCLWKRKCSAIKTGFGSKCFLRVSNKLPLTSDVAYPVPANHGAMCKSSDLSLTEKLPLSSRRLCHWQQKTGPRVPNTPKYSLLMARTSQHVPV